MSGAAGSDGADGFDPFAGTVAAADRQGQAQETADGAGPPRGRSIVTDGPGGPGGPQGADGAEGDGADGAGGKSAALVTEDERRQLADRLKEMIADPGTEKKVSLAAIRLLLELSGVFDKYRSRTAHLVTSSPDLSAMSLKELVSLSRLK